MNERIRELAELAGYNPLPGFDFANDLQEVFLKKFAELVAEECAQICGSQADKKNIRRAFGLGVTSDVKYPAPEADNSINSQYTRKINLPQAGAVK